jgi:hypothetical protein
MKPFPRKTLRTRSSAARLATSALILNKIITGELSNSIGSGVENHVKYRNTNNK